MPRITRPQSLPSCKRGCTEWCARCCPGSSLGRRNCCGGWRGCNCATRGPDAPIRSAEPPVEHWQAPLPESDVVILIGRHGRAPRQPRQNLCQTRLPVGERLLSINGGRGHDLLIGATSPGSQLWNVSHLPCGLLHEPDEIIGPKHHRCIRILLDQLVAAIQTALITTGGLTYSRHLNQSQGETRRSMG